MERIEFEDALVVEPAKVSILDEMPIGTEVDYDGDEVPAGWEEIPEKSIVTANIKWGELTANTETKLGLESNINIKDGFTVNLYNITINRDMNLKLSANVTVQDQAVNPTNYFATFRIFKNGERIISVRNVASDTTTYMTLAMALAPMLLDVKQGDSIEIYVNTSHDSTILNSSSGVANITLEEV